MTRNTYSWVKVPPTANDRCPCGNLKARHGVDVNGYAVYWCASCGRGPWRIGRRLARVNRNGMPVAVTIPTAKVGMWWTHAA